VPQGMPKDTFNNNNNNNSNNNKSIYVAPILSSAKRFTMQEKDLVKK